MQGRMCRLVGLFFILSFLAFSSCSQKSLLTADCHSCTESYSWKQFSWNELEGTWKGSYESMKSDKLNPKKVRSEKPVEFRFLNAQKFLHAQNVTGCSSLDSQAVVLNGVLWESDTSNSARREYDVFTPAEEGTVAYGRMQIEKVNGESVCRVLRLGRVMGTNRLSLPTISFQQGANRRVLASDGISPETEVSVEFLRFDALTAKEKQTVGESRRPAALNARERPPLMFRVYRVTSQTKKTEQGSEWLASDEQIFRLWRTQ